MAKAATKNPKKGKAKAEKTPAKVKAPKRDPKLAALANKDATDYHKWFARFLTTEVGYDPDSASSNKAAFLAGIRLALTARTSFMESDFLEELREKHGINKRGPKPKGSDEDDTPQKGKKAKKKAKDEDPEDDEFDDEDDEETEDDESDEDDDEEEDDDDSEEDDEDDSEDDEDDEDEDDDEEDEDEDEEEDEPTPPKKSKGKKPVAKKAPAKKAAPKKATKKDAPAKKGDKASSKGAKKVSKKEADDEFLF